MRPCGPPTPAAVRLSHLLRPKAARRSSVRNRGPPVIRLPKARMRAMGLAVPSCSAHLLVGGLGVVGPAVGEMTPAPPPSARIRIVRGWVIHHPHCSHALLSKRRPNFSLKIAEHMFYSHTHNAVWRGPCSHYTLPPSYAHALYTSVLSNHRQCAVYT